MNKTPSQMAFEAISGAFEQEIVRQQGLRIQGYANTQEDALLDALRDFASVWDMEKCEGCNAWTDAVPGSEAAQCTGCKDDESGCQRVDIRQLEAQRYNRKTGVL